MEPIPTTPQVSKSHGSLLFTVRAFTSETFNTLTLGAVGSDVQSRAETKLRCRQTFTCSASFSSQCRDLLYERYHHIEGTAID